MKTRDAYYDNAKFLLIFLVVFGHFIQSYIHEDKFIYTVYTTIYTFHMPAFILISGFFAKGFRKPGYYKKLTKKLIIPYLIFQGIYSLYYVLINERSVIELNPLNPQWSLWFLLSLFFWNVMLFLFTKWKPLFALSLSVGIGIGVGYFNEINHFLSLSRTFVFFPFFLLGYYLNKNTFEKVRDRKVKYTSFFILFSLFVAVYLLPGFDYKWLFGSRPYEALHYSYVNGGIIRLALYALTLLTTLSFLALVPRQRYFFTKWGTSSIYVYLLHGFFVRYFRSSELVGYLSESEQIIVLIFLSLLLIAFLSSKLVRRISEPFVELKSSYFTRYRLDSGYDKRY
ncbi:acyltransferase family protein [Bacillus sp. B15-48]|uniref:acyltransferase family protein n=1 Tax=Bacillus sp. B15-48 TaxID=1548601 RepID=UPI001940081F|nr:acyltransferase family protein [Bacillus sp. B15-48]MBM4764778.1 acyltransferase family protein [Bacillus sp. B15-48]